MALRFNIIPVEFHFKFEQCVANIRKKPALTLDIAAAYHEQLQLMTDYIDIFNMDDAIVNIMLDSFIALTYQLSLSVTECLLSELGILYPLYFITLMNALIVHVHRAMFFQKVSSFSQFLFSQSIRFSIQQKSNKSQLNTLF